MHVHHAPDAHIARSVDAFQAAAQAEAAGMTAIVLKNHDYSTAPLAALAGQQTKRLKVVGSLCLDFGVGGLNLAAAEISAALGAKVVWMPTFSAAYDMMKRGLGPGGINIVDEVGEILPVVTDILKVIKQHDMIVASGHVSFQEIAALVDRALELGIRKIVVTHALEPRFGATLSIEQQKQMAARGAYIEHTYLSALPSGGGIGLKAIADAVKAVGPGHCILSTDLGQKENPTPAVGLRTAIVSLLEQGLSEDDLTVMMKTNPAWLLGLG
jgi:imidazolonepropionase-like amidohydrolase